MPDDLDQFESYDSHAEFTAYVPVGSVAKGEALVTNVRMVVSAVTIGRSIAKATASRLVLATALSLALAWQPTTRASSDDGPPAWAGDFVNPQDALVLGWNQYRIEVNNNVIKVALNGTDTAQYTIPDPATVHFPPPWDQRRGRYPASEPTFIGLQSYSNYSYTTAFRNIRATVL